MNESKPRDSEKGDPKVLAFKKQAFDVIISRIFFFSITDEFNNPEVRKILLI